MGLLDEFLCALTQAEREQLAQLPLKGKENLVLRALMPHGTNCVVKPPQFGIGIDHLNKIQSVLLRKCYGAISGNDDIKLIWFLSQRHLNKHMYREVHRVEQEVKAQNLTNEELLPYYKEFFFSSVDVMARFFDPTMARHYMEQYLALVPDAELEMERCNTNAKFAYPYLIKSGMKVMTDAERDEMGHYLRGLLADSRRLNHLEAMVLNLKNLVYYHNYTRPNLHLRYQYLCEMEQIVEQSPPGYFAPIRHAIVRTDMADFLCSSNRLSEALEKFRSASRDFNEWMANKPYHHAKHIQTAILCGEMEEAFSILDKCFKRSITHHHPSLSPMAATLYAMYYLHLPHMEQCRKYVDILWEVNNKQEYLTYEVNYRALETTWLWVNNQHETANIAAARHIKFLRSRKIKQSYDPLCLVFPFVQALYRARITRNPLGLKHLAMKEQLHQGHFAIYGRLLF